MSVRWLDFLKPGKDGDTPDEVLDIPLFPLGGVLFPEGLMSLKVFEQRYLDMAAASMKDGSPFGVCLIQSGKEVGEPAVPHAIGTLAHIVDGDMPQLGILMLRIRGGQRFRIISQAVDRNGLLRGRVELLDEAPPTAIPDGQLSLLPLLRKIVGDVGAEKIAEPHRFDDAAWVGYRLCEIVPVQMLAKQKLLELADPVSRLEILHTYLAQRKIVS